MRTEEYEDERDIYESRWPRQSSIVLGTGEDYYNSLPLIPLKLILAHT